MSKPFHEARWIWTADPGDASFSLRRFRSRFTVDSPERLIIHVSADSRYALYIDGLIIGRGPARSDLRNYVYDTYVVQVEAGEHLIAAAVVAYSNHTGPGAEMHDRGAFLLEARNSADAVRSATGRTSEWKVQCDTAYTPTRLTFQDSAYFAVGSMEDVEGALVPHGWQDISFDDTSWDEPLAPFPPFLKGQHFDPGDIRWRLSPRDIPAMREELKTFVNAEHDLPLYVAANERREIILDAGNYAIGYPSIEIEGGEGGSVTLTYAEALIRDGQKGKRDDPNGGVVGLADTYRPGGETESYQPLHWRAFRFVKVTAHTGDYPMTVNRVNFHKTGYPWKRRSEFEVEQGPTELKSVLDVDFRTLECCTWETFMDCPYYEQLQYVGDTRLQALLSYVTTGDTRLGARAVKQFDASRIPEGLTASRYPSNFEQIIPPFSLMWILMVEDLWRYAPDQGDTVASCLNGCRSILEWFGRHLTPEGIVGPLPYWNFVDWSWDWGVPPSSRAGLPSATISLQYLAALQAYVRMHDGLGDQRESEFWQAQADMLADSIALTFWDPDARLLREGPDDSWGITQHAQAWGILTGVIPDEAIDDVVESLHTDDTLVKTTFYHTFYVIEALAKVGRLEKLWEKWLAPWRDALEMGLTTWPEQPEPTRSDCHAWSAWPTFAFLTHVLGVKPADPGFSGYVITPQRVDGWERVTGSVPTPDGMLTATVEWNDERPSVKAEIRQDAA